MAITDLGMPPLVGILDLILQLGNLVVLFADRVVQAGDVVVQTGDVVVQTRDGHPEGLQSC